MEVIQVAEVEEPKLAVEMTGAMMMDGVMIKVMMTPHYKRMMTIHHGKYVVQPCDVYQHSFAHVEIY
jgi:hypothetical protein